MKTLREQVNAMLNAKIKRISATEYAKANPNAGGKHKPYSLPSCVDTMVKMLGRIESATDLELESFASYATTGEAREMSLKSSAS